MRVLFYIVATLVVMGLGNWAYVENYKTKAALEGAAFVCRSVSNDLAAELLDRRQQGLTQLGRRWRDDDAGSFHCRDLVFGTALAA